MKTDISPIQTALFSVTDKGGLTAFAHGLLACRPSLTIIASGGTANMLEKEGIPYKPLEEYTGFPECFGGRVKTLHPKVMGGILMRGGRDGAEAQKLHISPIELVVCNLYDFASASQNKELAAEQLMESMDIGGSTLIRASVKNFQQTLILVDPLDYSAILEEVQHCGGVSLRTRQKMAAKAIQLSARYEALLAEELSKRLEEKEFRKSSHKSINLHNGKQLRYGENPSQKAWVYQFAEGSGIAQAQCLSGKELSYNNYEDATVAYQSAEELRKQGFPFAVSIVKHGNICGYATDGTLKAAFEAAWECDSKSAFGSIVAVTAHIDEGMIETLKGRFIEILIAPGFSTAFVQWTTAAKPHLRLLVVPSGESPSLFYKAIGGGMLIQTGRESLFPKGIASLFHRNEERKGPGVVTERTPDPSSQPLFLFAVAAVNFVKSNAIAIVRERGPGQYQLLAAGGGQPNRIDCLQRLAIPKAIEKLKEENSHLPNYNPMDDLSKCVLASDGFFPFDDSITFAARHGIKNCIQPGGSARDAEVIHKADEVEMCMIFTGERYFYH